MFFIFVILMTSTTHISRLMVLLFCCSIALAFVNSVQVTELTDIQLELIEFEELSELEESEKEQMTEDVDQYFLQSYVEFLVADDSPIFKGQLYHRQHLSLIHI